MWWQRERPEILQIEKAANLQVLSEYLLVETAKCLLPTTSNPRPSAYNTRGWPKALLADSFDTWIIDRLGIQRQRIVM